MNLVILIGWIFQGNASLPLIYEHTVTVTKAFILLLLFHQFTVSLLFRDGNNWSYEKCCRQWNLVDDSSLRYQFLNAWDAAMMRLEVKYSFMQHQKCNVTRISEEAKIIIAERGPLVFAFNFSSTSNVKDIEVLCFL